MNYLPQITVINDISVKWLARFDNYRGWYAVSESNFLIAIRLPTLEALQEAVKNKLIQPRD